MSKRPDPHPDDFMTVTLSLEFRAKPHSSASPAFGATGAQLVLAAADAADYLEKVATAIRERRLYGFMAQDAAESHVAAGEWIEEVMDDPMAKATTCQPLDASKEENRNAADAQHDQ